METDKNVSTMVQSASGAVAGFSWANNGIGYSVVGAASPDILHPLANQVRAQIDAPSMSHATLRTGTKVALQETSSWNDGPGRFGNRAPSSPRLRGANAQAKGLRHYHGGHLVSVKPDKTNNFVI